MSDRLDRIVAADDWRELAIASLCARVAADEGRYCQCAQPSVTGLDLMCGECLLQNRDQEIKRLHSIVDAHEFIPGKLRGLMCKICTQTVQEPRHHGVPAVGRTSWGTEVTGV